MNTDRIERELVIAAPIDRVWRAITEPDRIAKWFGDTVELDARPGGSAIFGWDGDGRFHAVVERVVEPTEFAYRWCLTDDTPVALGPSTLVEFFLADRDGQTALRLVESGFDAITDVDARDRHRADNIDGWAEELAELARHVETYARTYAETYEKTYEKTYGEAEAGAKKDEPACSTA